MYFHIEERKAWVRNHTHTVVSDRDPDYERFAQDPSGNIRRIIRVWVAEPISNRPFKRAYLGAAIFFACRFSLSELHLMFHRASAFTDDCEEPVKTVRHQLADTLRKYISQYKKIC